MAISKALIASLLISLLVLQLVEAVVCISHRKYTSNTISIYLTKHTSYIYPFSVYSLRKSQTERMGLTAL